MSRRQATELRLSLYVALATFLISGGLEMSGWISSFGAIVLIGMGVVAGVFAIKVGLELWNLRSSKQLRVIMDSFGKVEEGETVEWGVNVVMVNTSEDLPLGVTRVDLLVVFSGNIQQTFSRDFSLEERGVVGVTRRFEPFTPTPYLAPLEQQSGFIAFTAHTSIEAIRREVLVVRFGNRQIYIGQLESIPST